MFWTRIYELLYNASVQLSYNKLSGLSFLGQDHMRERRRIAKPSKMFFFFRSSSSSLFIYPFSEICIFLVHRSSLFVSLSVAEGDTREDITVNIVINKKSGTTFQLPAKKIIAS